MRKHLFILWLAIGIFGIHSFSQVSQFPQVYYNGQGTGGTNLNIRSAPSLSSGSVLTSLATTARIGAETFTMSTETNGTATWAKVCLPGTSGNIIYGYMLYGEYYARIYQNNNYATTTANLNIRTGAGTSFSNVTIGGVNATFGNNSIVALTGSTSVVSGITWYQVYLTNNCSQTTGWASGQFLNIPSTQNYYIVAGTVENSSSVRIWGATISIGSWTTNSTEGFYQYKLPVSWSGLITCTHPNYNTSTPASYNHTANNHNYSRNFILSNSCPTQTTPTANAASNQSQTGFRANWSSASGATGYRLDVSTSNTFSSFVSGYNNLDVGNTTSRDVTALACNTTYYYRLRAYNSCGNISSNSSTINTTTTTCSCPTQAAPTTNSASNQSQTGFRANWSTASGATGYRLDVSTNNTFSTFVSGYNNLDVGNVTSSDVTGLACNTTYYYRVRAYNNCGNISGNSSIITASTTSCSCPTQNTPTANAANNQSQTGFRANWSSASGATGYRLDVSTNNTFSTFISGYNNLDVGNTTSRDVTGLTCNTTYYYRIRAYNNCGNNSGNSSSISATTATCTSTPSSITISNVIENNSTFSSPKILWSGNTNQSSATIKICADGSAATRIKFTNNTGIASSNIKFWIASDPYGNNSDLSGYFINYSVSGNMITAELAHPKYLPSNYRPSKNDQIRIVDFNSPNQTIFSLPLEVYRAPILMVHGLWGSTSSFETIDNYIETNSYQLPLLTLRADYESTNDYYFAINQFVVPSGINVLLNRARSLNISTGKVDVIAHSMGGLISRYYLQSQAYQQKKDIHKLITLNTPHSGSPWGNLVNNITTQAGPIANLTLSSLAVIAYNGSLHNGAIEDLAINSSALNYLNTTTLNNGIVPTHVITTTSSPINEYFWYLVAVAVAPSLSMTPSQFFDYLCYSQGNDLVVSVPSQSGGVPINARTTYPNIMHTASPDNSFILSEVINAININSANTNYFTQNGFSPEIINSHFRPMAPTEFNRIQNSVTINNPLQNQSFNPGDIVPVDISTNNGVNRIVLEGISYPDSSNFVDTSFINGIVNYRIPTHARGKMKFIAIGYNSNNLVDYDTVTININKVSALDRISFQTDTLIVQVNNIAAIPLRAYYANGSYDNLNFLSDVRFSIVDSSLATIMNEKIIRGKSVGITSVKAIYLNKSTEIPLLVIPEDTTIKYGFKNTDTTNSNPVTILNPTESVKVYPNPNKGDFTIFAALKDDDNVSIEIFNQIGQRIFVTQRKSINKIVRTYISLGYIPNGMYYIKMTGKNEKQTGKFIILPDK